MIRTIVRKLKTAVTLPAPAAFLALGAWCLLWPARVIVLAVPVRKLSGLLGSDRGLGAEPVDLDDAQMRKAMRLCKALGVAARNSPVSEDCYPQALVAHMFLKAMAVPHTVFFGLRRAQADEALDAHAWVLAGEVPVCGGGAIGDYTVVRCFATD